MRSYRSNAGTGPEILTAVERNGPATLHCAPAVHPDNSALSIGCFGTGVLGTDGGRSGLTIATLTRYLPCHTPRRARMSGVEPHRSAFVRAHVRPFLVSQGG